ncbi:MAG: hypothetical protein IE938_19290 [Pseudomonas balearica]|nr:hypothetical protein [Stutzerimonas balearica]
MRGWQEMEAAGAQASPPPERHRTIDGLRYRVFLAPIPAAMVWLDGIWRFVPRVGPFRTLDAGCEAVERAHPDLLKELA